MATRICAELAECLGSAAVIGIGGVSVLQVCVLLSLVPKLDGQTLVHRINQLTWTLPVRAPAETVEYASRTVEDGGRERLWSGCELLYIALTSSQGRFHYPHRSKWLNMRRGRSRTAAESVCGLDVNQSLSQLTKCIPLTVHKAPELTKLQAASYVGVR